jgi:hypothetical protein
VTPWTDHGQATHTKDAVAQQGKSIPEDSLDVMFVDLVALVPAKGKFDMNKIKSESELLL